METSYSMDRLISWIVRNSEKAKHHMSLSGLPEVVFRDFGIKTDLGEMKGSIHHMEEELTDTLSGLYDIPQRNMIITTGGSESIFLISHYAIRNGFRISVGLPEYPPIFSVPEQLGSRVMKIPWASLGEGNFKGGQKNALFFSNPNNPQGDLRVSPESEDMLPLKPGKTNLVYADEAFIEFGFGDKPRSLYHCADGMVINGSMTKFYGFSNLRVGWIAGPVSMIQELRNLRSITGAQNPVYPMWIAKQALLSRSRFQDRARQIIHENLRVLRKFVQDHEELHFIGNPTNSSYCLIGYDFSMRSEDFCEALLKEQGVLLSPGDYFGTERSFRLCFTQRPGEFAESLSAFEGFLEKVR
ncbi:MAG: aminotransferase class I/II-fold pyridoxal phosphate-dependent enzyme [Candidatus Thermoplasmatota archaeon]|nr:aminotransferase class I/II-fold pyridoxal phosphate-dependent enzyme [Candidatus Thermoplasmatota archaeon]